MRDWICYNRGSTEHTYSYRSRWGKLYSMPHNILYMPESTGYTRSFFAFTRACIIG